MLLEVFIGFVIIVLVATASYLSWRSNMAFQAAENASAMDDMWNRRDQERAKEERLSKMSSRERRRLRRQQENIVE